MTNKEFAEKNAAFKKSCSAAKVLPTKRQASKFRRGLGSAFKVLEEAEDVTE